MWWPFLLGIIVGVAIGLLYGIRWKVALRSHEARLAEVTKRAEEAETLREENEELKIELEKARATQEVQEEKLRWAEEAKEILRETFQALASEVLKTNADEFLKRARDQLEAILAQVRGDWGAHREELKGLIKPLEQTLERMDEQVRQLERKREGAYQSLVEQLRQLASAQENLRASASQLLQALKAPTARGRWGELQLRRVVELAGLQKHVDFEEQAQTDEGRPDMIVHLPKGGILAVDAKVPMDAYLAAVEATDETTRRQYLANHARALRQRIHDLSRKRYWEQFDGSPAFVVMFVPSEACIAAAFECDPTILEDGFKNGVVVASPTTLLSLLKAVAYGWQQHEISENAREITQQALELYQRFVVFLEHLKRVGDRLRQTVESYNRAVGSATNRLLPAARRLEERASRELPELPPVDESPRPLPHPESESPG